MLKRYILDSATVTIVVPNYNHGIFLNRAISAILNQSRPADTILIVDDCSTDNSIEIIESIVAGRDNVVVIKNECRCGVVSIMNRELARCKTDYIVFAAADDYICSDFLTMSLSELESHPEAAFSAGCVTLRDGEWRVIGDRPILRPRSSTGFVSPDQARDLLLRGDNFFLGPAVVYRTAPLVAIGGFDRNLGPACDAMLQRRLAVRFGFVFISTSIAVWRIHGGNYSYMGRATADEVDRLCRCLRQVIDGEPPCLFPHNYGDLIERRVRFSTIRQMLIGDDDLIKIIDAILSILNPGKFQSKLIIRIAGFGSLGKILMLFLIAVRFRPFSMWWICREMIAARILRRRRQAG